MVKVFKSLHELYNNNPERVVAYAENLSKGINEVNLIQPIKKQSKFSADSLQLAVNNWSKSFDNQFGGYQSVPKFMMPNNLDVLLHYAVQQKIVPF